MKKRTALFASSFSAVCFIFSLALSGCGPKVVETPVDGWIKVTQRGGRTLGYSPESGVKLLEDKGFKFKDLNRNGELDPYEDWRLGCAARTEDLAARMSIEQIAGLMLYSDHQFVPFVNPKHPERGTYGGKSWPESGADTSALTDQQIKFLSEDNLRQILISRVASPSVVARWNNNVQAFVEGLGLGIPANNSSDPRNASRPTDEFNEGSGGKISIWPMPLGLAASFDPAMARSFGEVVSAEYRALGITTALSPQSDVATDPRWHRSMGTFGEEPRLVADFCREYVDAFQTSHGKDVIENGWGFGSVNCMVKHWPSGGSGEGGRDAHMCFGKYAVFPGGNMQLGIDAFVNGAFSLNGPTKSATAVMPYYTISFGQDPSGKNVGNSYSHYLIQDLLRDKYGFEGVVCTDWCITGDNPGIDRSSNRPWGVEHLSVAERHFEILKAGVDQFGGNNQSGPILEAYRLWVEEFGKESADARFRLSAKRLLLNFFRTGIFENPYLEIARTEEIVANPEFVKKGYEAQLKSVVMLKNHGGVLPVKGPKKVYHPQRRVPNEYGLSGGIRKAAYTDWPISPEILGGYYTFTEDPAEADFAIVQIGEPVSGRGYSEADARSGGNGYLPISLQWEDYTAEYAREVSVAGGDPREDFTNRSYRGKSVVTENKGDLDLVRDTRKALGDKPLIVVLPVSRPVVLADFEPWADAILISFGVKPQAYLDIISGAFEPSALLPMQFPASMKTVEEQFEDTPRDMEPYTDADGHSYDFAYGMNWSGVIDDARVRRYR